MYNRELGCKTIGCFSAAILVFGFFAYLLNMAQDLADKQHQPSTQIAVTPQNKEDNFDMANIGRLPLLLQAAKLFADAHGGMLPPMDSPEAFKAAVYPKYGKTEDMFIAPRTQTPYLTNPALSGKKFSAISNPQTVVAFYEPMPTNREDSARPRSVIFASGALHVVDATEWPKLQKTLGTPTKP